jgi:DNA-binding transcriptional regulator YhcF (GntR family)
MKKIINNIEYDLTAEDIEQREQDIIKAEADKVIREEKIAQEKARKESAIAKLKALGLTEEEVKSIL